MIQEGGTLTWIHVLERYSVKRSNVSFDDYTADEILLSFVLEIPPVRASVRGVVFDGLSLE